MNERTRKALEDIGVTITEEGMRYDLFLEHSWMMLVARLDSKLAEDPLRLIGMKTAYWAGAASMLEAIQSIDDYQVIQDAVNAPPHVTAKYVHESRQALREGLERFGASLNPLRKLDS